MDATAQDAGRRAADSVSYQELTALLARLGGAVVAFSGGVDSSLLAAAAHDALGDRALAVTACSPTYPAAERQRAVEVARLIGVRHRLVDSHETEQDAFRANPPDRCYHCKQELFALLDAIARQEGFAAILDGNNADDARDYRPGRVAARENGVRSPLAELGLGKDAVRMLARQRGLPNWDAPACACLASRIPYGDAITPDRLDRVDRAEAAIRALGFRVVRVRDHGPVARVELGPGELGEALAAERRALLAAACRTAGYVYATLDLDGYRIGSMNAVLPVTPLPAPGGRGRSPRPAEQDNLATPTGG